MFRLYYKPETGIISYIITADWASPNEILPYIEYPTELNIHTNKVNLTSLQVEPFEPTARLTAKDFETKFVKDTRTVNLNPLVPKKTV